MRNVLLENQKFLAHEFRLEWALLFAACIGDDLMEMIHHFSKVLVAAQRNRFVFLQPSEFRVFVGQRWIFAAVDQFGQPINDGFVVSLDLVLEDFLLVLEDVQISLQVASFFLRLA